MNFWSLYSVLLEIPKLSVLSGTNITKIIPEPNEMHIFNGFWKIPNQLSMCLSDDVPSTKSVANYFQTIFYDHTGKKVSVDSCKTKVTVENEYQLHIFYDEALTNEGYDLTVNEKGIVVKASSLPGFFYAAKTLDQLIDDDLSITYLDIKDHPRFGHRGLMLDSCRHFFNTSTIKNLLSIMADYKLNVFHWHLTEDQGWRIEIKKYPKLSEISSKRAASPVKFHSDLLDNKTYGPYFYTQEEIKDIIEYAKKLHITVIPEIEMPGHSVAALSAYPEYSCTGGPFEPRCRWGITEDVYCAGNDDAIHFLENILDEVTDLFESNYIHIGGDECPKTRWAECPKCQKRIKEKNLKDENELQSWFIRHFVDYLSKKGKRTICWDDVVNDKILGKDTIVMTWHDPDVAIKAANDGHQVIMCPTKHLYFDYSQLPEEPYEYIGGYLTLKNVYSYNPSDGFPPERDNQILGAQGNIWTEYVHSVDDLEWKIFPRMLALSESVWTELDKKSWSLFYHKLKYKHLNHLKKKGVNVAPADTLPSYEWKCEGKGTWEPKEWNVTPFCPTPGNFSIDFTFLSGGRSLIRSVKLVADGEIQGTDMHLSFIGPRNNVSANYQVDAPNRIRGFPLFLQAEIRCNESANGYIYFDRSFKIPETIEPDVNFLL